MWRVFVSDHTGSPVIARSLSTHTSGAAAASSVRPASSRCERPSCRVSRSESRASRCPPRLVCIDGRRPRRAGQAIRYSQYSPENTHASGRSSPASASSASTGQPARGRRGLDEQRAQHEQQIGDVDVRAHAVGEHRHARDQQQRGERPGGAPEPACGERVDHPSARRQRQERERDRHLQDAVRPERSEHDAEHLDQRMGRGRDRDAVRGRAAARELPAPGERVQRVVVDEPHARDHAQHDRPDDDRRGRDAGASSRLAHARGRYPVARAHARVARP